MKRRGGLATIVSLILAGLFGFSYLPKKAADAVKAKGTAEVSPATTSATSAVLKAGDERLLPECEQIMLHLKRFYPGSNAVPIPADEVCDAPARTSETTPLSVAILIAPNPVETHLPLVFDRLVDAVQQAVQDSGFNFDSAWFPWNSSQKSDKPQSEPQQSADLDAEMYAQPGIIVFRHGAETQNFADAYTQGVVIFVVAEQPTGGVNDVQFAHAIAWAKALRSRPLRIIGPTFSGTLSSLQHALLATAAFNDFSGGVKIFSGATSASENVRAFQGFLNKQPVPSNDGGSKFPLPQFRTFSESDRLMTDRFLCYMQHGGYDLSYFAILSEDETAFGEAPKNANAVAKAPLVSNEPRCTDRELNKANSTRLPEGKPLYLYYPRDIANLRSAYEQQSVFSAGKQQSGSGTSLKEDFSEPIGAEHDSVRSYAGKLTPQSQEAILFDIANTLASRNIEFIIIRSSNPLDQLFLSEFFRRSYPSGRIVLDGADLLFRRGMEGASLRGVMMLSTYPLLTWTHDAVPTIEGPPGSASRLFPQDVGEGTYIATRELLRDVPGVPASGAANSVSIADYAPPHFEENPNPHEENPNPSKENANPPKPEIPPTWLSVVGHRQFWPLAYLNEDTEKEEGRDGKYFGPTDKESLLAGEVNSGNRWGKTGLPLEIWGLLFGCLILAVWHLYCCANGSIHRSPKAACLFRSGSADAAFSPDFHRQLDSRLPVHRPLALHFGARRDGVSHANSDGDERYHTGDLFFRLSRSCGQLPPTARLR